MIVSPVTLAIAAVTKVALASEIVLTVASGPAAGQCVLTWTGGTSPYQVHRANGPQGVATPATLIGLASQGNTGFADTAVPGAGAAYFYVVVSGTCGDGVVDLNEACDDGGVIGGDGCSAACQVETPASLALTPGAHDFGSGLAGSASASASFQLTNQGEMTSGALSLGLVAGATGDFVIASAVAGDCMPGAPLAGQSSCTVPTRFAPLSAGGKQATLEVAAAPGGTQQASLTGTGLWPLTLNVSGTGQVTRDGVPACSGGCPETTGHADGAVVTFVASTQNGTGRYFSGWSGACTGLSRTCMVTMTAQRDVTATFSSIAYNLVFVSSTAQAANLGGAAAYDSRCNALATAAGLNNALGTGYVAWVADSTTSVPGRLGTARGWVRLDGRPFATTFVSLTAGAVYYPPRIDENGVDVGSRTVLTGVLNNGTTSGTNCSNWTSSAAIQFTGGNAASGSGGWSNTSPLPSCSNTYSVYCLMKTSMTTLVPTPETGKQIFLSGTYTPGLSMTPDQRCDFDKPAGMGAVKALVATTTSAAASVLSPAQRYVRPDGTFIGTGADLAAGGRLTSGMWQMGNGVYAGDGQRAWTGAATLTAPGTAATSCADWTSSATTGWSGAVASSDTAWWTALSQSCGATSNRIYCVEQ